MRKLLVTLLLLALFPTFALAAPQTIDLETMTLEELQMHRTEVDAAISAVIPEPESEEVIVGEDTSRKAPAPIGQTVLYEGDNWYCETQVEITVTKVVRGDAAWSAVKRFNRYNDKPSKEQEYILAYVKCRAVESDDDTQAELNNYRFTFVSETGAEYDSAYISGLTPEITNLYPGAECEGIVAGKISVDDKPMLVFIKQADSPAWFDLNRRKPITLSPDTILNPLKKGDKGDEVLAMQAMLAEMGYLKVSPDGDYGGKTVDAVKAYQKAVGVEQTGIADEATLRLILTAQTPTP